MGLIKVAKSGRRPLRLLGGLQVLLHLSPDVAAHRVRNIQALVVPAGIDCAEDGKQRLVRLEHHLWRGLGRCAGQAKAQCPCDQQGSHDARKKRAGTAAKHDRQKTSSSAKAKTNRGGAVLLFYQTVGWNQL